jgi:hypothetical protein
MQEKTFLLSFFAHKKKPGADAIWTPCSIVIRQCAMQCCNPLLNCCAHAIIEGLVKANTLLTASISYVQQTPSPSPPQSLCMQDIRSLVLNECNISLHLAYL